MKTPPKNNNQKFFFISSDPSGIHQECEYINDEDIEELMIKESFYVASESYA
jgi:hypothetical protein